MTSKNEDDLKNVDHQNNEDDLKNKKDLKNEDNLKKLKLPKQALLLLG